MNDVVANPLPCYFVKRSALAAKRTLLSDITSSVAPNSVCMFRSPIASPTSSPTATRRRASSVEPASIEQTQSMVPICPMKRRTTVHKMTGRVNKDGNGLSRAPELEFVPDDDDFSLDESSLEGMDREKLVALMGLQEKLDLLKLNNNEYSKAHSKEC